MSAGLLILTAAPSASAAAERASSASPGASCDPQAGSNCGTPIRPLVTGHVEHVRLSSPLSTSQCQAQLGISCYTPTQYDVAYGLDALHAHGVTGAGKTIVILDAFGSPTIQHDLNTFDAQFGLPNTTVNVVKSGTIPPFDPNNADMVGWAVESTLDVEYAHAVAPGAKIVLVTTPVSETEGVTGFPELMNALQTEVNRGVGDVVSMSFGSAEQDFYSPTSGYASLLNLRYAFKDAAAHGVTLVSGTGDVGAAGINLDNSTLSTIPEESWPAIDPEVTAVGGTQLHLDDAGNRISPDTVWNDGYGASGGGLSVVFNRPAYQDSVRSVVGNHRGMPDVSMSSAVNGGAWVYMSMTPAETGWGIIGGTSEATPMFAGEVALADQFAGHRLGNVNDDLYELQALGGDSEWTGLTDVTSGNNTFAGVTGYSAGPGYDLASGLGTPNGNLVYALAFAGRRR